MKRNPKRTLLAWLLTAAMLASLLPSAAFAASDEAAEEESAVAEQAEELTAAEQTEDSVIEEETAAESVSGQGYQLAEDSENATSGTIPNNAVEYNGHYYYLYADLATASDGTSAFEQAEAYCESLGGYLASITSQEEDNAVFEYLTSLGCTSAYFGLTDAETEGTWKWVSGESLVYTNWGDGEPNGSERENYGMFYYLYPSGEWNDGDWDGDSTSGTLAAFLCEWGDTETEQTSNIPDSAEEYNGHYYIVYDDSVTWTEAEAQCEALGGHLATITSEDEQAFIDEYNSSSQYLWIGGYREDDDTVWMWVTGETWGYTNWGDGEPNNSSNVVSNENRTVLWSGGYWNDLNDENTSESAGYICEWDNEDSSTMTQEELQKEYILQHINYYNNSYKTDIASMPSTVGLGFMMDDASNDLSDEFYEVLSTLTCLIDLGKYAEIEVEDVDNLTISIDFDPLDNIDTYSALLFQLMANDEVYAGIQNTFSLGLEKNIVSLSKLLLSNFEDLAKEELNQTAVQTAKETFFYAVQALDEMDSEADGYQAAWLDVADLCTEYLSKEKLVSFYEKACDTKDSIFAAIDVILKEINTFGEAYQFMCWAETYSETCNYFEQVLEDLSIEAKKQYELELLWDKYDAVTPGSDGYQYKCIYESIDEWLEDMDAYEESAYEAFADQIVNGTATNIAEVGVSTLVKIGTSLIPFLGPMNKALKAGKLGIDLFTTIDDEYKASYTVTCLSYLTNLLVAVSDNYGLNLLAGGTLEEALLFDESINIYKNAILLACDYGMKYEELKLASVSQGLNEKYNPLSVDTLWYYDARQMAASTYSMALSLLALQKMEVGDIHCHEDGLTYDNSTGLVEYTDSARVISVFCPVDITVYDENGTQLAYLTNGTAEVSPGYEHYFYIVPEDNEENDYIKVAIVPDNKDYEIIINGTDTGTMTVFVGRYNGEEISEVETYINFAVTDSTEGYIDTGDQENTLGHLVINETVYGYATEKKDDGTGESGSVGDTTHTHTWDEGTVTLAATRVSEGEKIYTCTVCGETKTETVAKLTGSAASFLFDDVTNEESWYYTAVYWAYDLGITEGYSDNTFRPNNNCTRAEFATFLYALANAYGLENAGDTESKSFTDVAEGSWYYTYVMWAAENGLVSGYTDGTFKPNNQITRAEAVTMLYGFYKTFVNGGVDPELEEETETTFSDLSEGSWYYTYMLWAIQNGVVSGYPDGTCRPNTSCTRSVMVVLLYATAEHLLSTT